MNSKMTDPTEDVTTALQKAKKMIATVDQGWDTIKARPERTYFSKTVDSWNKNDLRGYFNDQFFEKVGSPFPDSAKPQIAYSVFNEISTCLTARLGEDCINSILKSYFDFFLENYLNEVMSKYRISYNTLKYDKYMNCFVDYKKRQKSLISITTPTIATSITFEELEKSSKVGRVYLLLEFGIPIIFQYLLFKKYPIDQIDALICNAIKRSKELGDFHLIVSSSKKYDYPVWFNLMHIDEILISLGESALHLTAVKTDKFEFLRSDK